MERDDEPRNYREENHQNSKPVRKNCVKRSIEKNKTLALVREKSSNQLEE